MKSRILSISCYLSSVTTRDTERREEYFKAAPRQARRRATRGKSRFSAKRLRRLFRDCARLLLTARLYNTTLEEKG